VSPPRHLSVRHRPGRDAPPATWPADGPPLLPSWRPLALPTGNHIPPAGSHIPHAGSPVPHAGSPVPHAGSPVPHAGSPVPHAGSPVPHAGSPVPHADSGEWTLGHRARQLYLDPVTLAGDLARIGLPVPVNRLGTLLAGDEPAPPVILAGLVDTLELRDPAVGDRPLVTAVAWSWRYAGWPVPTEILTILAAARNLSVGEVRDIAVQCAPAP
jgi:hypothetical protein